MPRSRHRDNNQASRRLRRKNNELRRQLTRMATSGQQAYATLLAILAQQGGEVTVTKGTVEQVSENFKNLSFIVSTKKGIENEFVVRLVETDPETEQAQADAEAAQSEAEQAAEAEDRAKFEEEQRVGDGVI